jgi:hypothetical protein
MLSQMRALVEAQQLEELHSKIGEFTALADNMNVINGEPSRDRLLIEAHPLDDQVG